MGMGCCVESRLGDQVFGQPKRQNDDAQSG